MAHFAKIVNSVVVDVIVADSDYISNHPAEWVQTSYNTRGGQHPENRPMRKNFAGIGYTYDKDRDAFIPPKLYPSWILNEETCLWEPPVAYPNDNNRYKWNEETQTWDLIQPAE